jgi:hypothetical protein
LFAIPLEIAGDFEAQAVVVAEQALFLQFFPHRNFEAAPLPGFEGVLVGAYVCPQLSAIVLIAPIAGWGSVIALFAGGEE